MPEFFRVVNFERFQHYRDRSPPWIKLYQSVLTDYEFTRLQDASKMHLLAIWLLASRYSNKIPWDEKWIAGQISATSKIDLDALEKANFISKINMVQNASTALAEGYQDARPERETETEVEREEEKSVTIAAATRLPPPAVNGHALDGFDSWWARYPSKIARKACAAKYAGIIAKREATAEQLLAGLDAYIANKPADRQWCHPLTWLNQGRWADQHAPTQTQNADEWLRKQMEKIA